MKIVFFKLWKQFTSQDSSSHIAYTLWEIMLQATIMVQASD